MKYPNPIISKFPNVKTTIFTVMSKLAQEHNAINLSQGFPDFSADKKLLDAVNTNMHKGFNQYAPMPGVMALREKIAEKTEELYSAKYNPDTEITITAGATQAIFTAILSVIKEDDEVIIFEPAYDCYLPAIELAGGKPVFIPLTFPGFTIDWEFVKKMINHKTRMIIINTPNNPSGTILNAADIQKLEKLVKNTDILILSDEVYEHIIFDGYEHQSIARYPKLAERSFIVSSFGKTYHTTGWKIGYIIAPEALTAEFRKAHQYNVFCVNTPMQYALAEFLNNKDAYLELGKFYEEKRNYFNKLLKGSKFKLAPSTGTYFQLLNYSAITDEKDTDFAVRLTKEIGVASIPISVFYHKPIDNKLLRFCFAKGNETLEKAVEKLQKL